MKRIRLSVRSAAIWALLFATACGSGISAEMACSDFAKATCNKIDQCRKNGTQLAYGTLGLCITRQQANCAAVLVSPSVGNNSDFYENCAMALPGESCQDFLQGNPVGACVTKNGGIANGTACTFSTQCQSGFCATVKGTNCGTCQNTPAAGDPCTDIGCARNQTCTPNQVCEPYVATGGACDTKTNICAPGQACVIATGMTTGLCQPRGTTVGATCDSKRVTGPDCDPNAGLFCDAMTLKCVADSYGSSSCGLSNSGHTLTMCTGGGLCVSASCMAAVAEGGSCDTSAGPPCLAPARCVTGGGGSTSGTCMLLDATMCM